MRSPRLHPAAPWLNWGVAVAYLMLGFGFQCCYAILNRQIADKLSLTPTDIGIVGSTYTWCFAVAQLLSGALLDRLGARRVLPKACALLTIGIFCFAWSPGFVGLVIAQVLVAVGASFGFVVAGFMSRMWFSPQRYGFMFALAQFSVSFFAFFCQHVLARGLEGLPYAWMLSGLGGAGLVLLAAMLLWLRDPPVNRNDFGNEALSGALPEQLKRLLRGVAEVLFMPGLARIILIGAASFGTMLSLSAVWGPRLLIAQGLPPEAAGAAVSFGWLGLATGAPLITWQAQKFNQDKIMIMLGLILQCLCVSLLLIMETGPVWLRGGIMFCWGFGAGANMLPFVLAARCAGESRTGTAMALVNCGQYIAGGLLVYIPGRLLDMGLGIGLGEALAVLPIFLLVTLVLCFRLKTGGSTRGELPGRSGRETL